MRTSGRTARPLVVATAAALGGRPGVLAARPLHDGGRGSTGTTQGSEGIPTIDVLKSTIRTYYNATDGIANKKTSPYITTGVGKSQQPSYITCAAAKCTTTEYKSQTRRHIQRDLGYRVLANFGDQFSDLAGGYARCWYKLPNPTYYLP